MEQNKVVDDDHCTRDIRGAANNTCNINYQVPDFIPVVFHNFSGYDAHLFVKSLHVLGGKPKGLRKPKKST